MMRYLIFLAFAFCTFVLSAMENQIGYDPWYTGPVVAPPSSCVPYGKYNFQWFLYYQTNYGIYDQRWSYKSTDDSLNLTNYFCFQKGLNDFMDATLDLYITYNEEDSHKIFNIMDTTVEIAFQLMKQKKYTWMPSLRLCFGETFPSGKYEKLDPEKQGIDATGGGAYVTSIQFTLAKIMYWLVMHPINMRFSFSYDIPTNVHVHNFNAYGGGYGTDGIVKAPKSWTTIFAFEFSFTQRIVYAMDFVYSHTEKTKFFGTSGFNADGTVADNTSDKKNQFSLCPALEYNFNENGGALAGIWFSVFGENTAAFICGAFSITYEF